jgi:hypothetical protein
VSSGEADAVPGGAQRDVVGGRTKAMAAAIASLVSWQQEMEHFIAPGLFWVAPPWCSHPIDASAEAA